MPPPSHPWLPDYLAYLRNFTHRNGPWNGMVPERWSNFAQGWLEEVSESMRGYDDIVAEYNSPAMYL